MDLQVSRIAGKDELAPERQETLQVTQPTRFFDRTRLHQNAPTYSFDATIGRLFAYFERIPRLDAWENGIMHDIPDTAVGTATPV